MGIVQMFRARLQVYHLQEISSSSQVHNCCFCLGWLWFCAFFFFGGGVAGKLLENRNPKTEVQKHKIEWKQSNLNT